MISLFSEVVNFDGVNFQDEMTRVNAFYIFEPLFTSTILTDNYLHIKIAKYIAYAYSMESGKISIGSDRRKELNGIFKNLEIEDEHYSGVVLLKNAQVLKSVQLWMDKQDSRQAEFLFTLQSAYVQQQTASLDSLKKSDGMNIDYDQKFKCIGYMLELKKMIKDAESELQQNDPKLKEAYAEVKMASKKTNTLGVEHYAK